MAKITITSTANSVRVDFGEYAPALERIKGVWRKESINFKLASNFITADIQGERSWQISSDGNSTDTPTLKIDNVDGAVPTDLADLFNHLQDLLT